MTFLNYYNEFILISKSNPLVAGAIGLWGAGLITWVFRKIPANIFNFIFSQITTSITINNASSSLSWEGNEQTFNSFMKWFSNSKYSKLSRYLSLNSENQETLIIGIGYGTHIFIYKSRLFWVHKTKLESAGTTFEKQQFIITVLGRSHKILYDLVEDFKHKKQDNEIYVNFWEGKDWSNPVYINKRNVNTVIVKKETKTRIINTIDYFYNNKDWYISRGLSYKLVYILHGIPGTGKTSFIKALASHFNKNIYSINLSSISDEGFLQALNTVQKGSFILIEDFDSSSSVKMRDKKKSENNNTESNIEDLLKTSFLSLSGILNALDGVVALNDLVIFMTTNHLEKIDPALLRKGRVSYIEEITPLEDIEIKEYINLLFPNENIPDNYTFKEINGCDIEGIFLDNKDNYNNFINSIPRIQQLI